MAYCSVSDVRQVSKMDDPSVFPDAVVSAAIATAEALIDAYCGTSFEAKAFSATLDGVSSNTILLPVLFPRSLTSVTIDGDAQTTTDWVLYETGRIVRDSGSFASTKVGGGVVVTGTAGVTTAAPREIGVAAKILAVATLLNDEQRVPDRALAVQNEFGNIQLAQAGGFTRPTEFPVVNAILNRNRHRPPTVG